MFHFFFLLSTKYQNQQEFLLSVIIFQFIFIIYYFYGLFWPFRFYYFFGQIWTRKSDQNIPKKLSSLYF